MIQLTKIEQEHRLNCPGCGHIRLVANPRSTSVHGGGYWLSDGDTIFGLYQSLVEAGLEKAVEAKSPSAWDSVNYDYELLVGECPSCNEEYFVLQVSMIDDGVEVDREFVESYFRGNAPIPEPANFIAMLSEKNLEWLVHRHDTPRGIALTHVLGPFGLNGMSMKGPYGVSACSSGDLDVWRRSRAFLFELWPQLKILARTVNQASETTAC